MKKLLLVLSAVLVLVHVIVAPRAATVAEKMTEVKGGSLAFNDARLPDSVLLWFFNDAQTMIATVGRTNEAETTFVLADTALAYVLPSDFYVLEAVIINPDPRAEGTTPAYPSALQVVPRRELGKGVVMSPKRPSQVSKWKDSLIFDRASESGLDTVTVDYFAYPVQLATVTDTIDLPEAYLPLLKDYVMVKCYDRIELTGPARTETEARIKLLEQTLLGRPADEK